MKKLFLLFALSLIVFSCNKDEITVEQENGFISDSIDPKMTPRAEFDESNLGMYHGIIVTEDVTFHGEIWINLGNDGNYNATVITVSGDKVSFFAEESNDNTYTFKGTRGTFDFDVTDFTNAIATNVTIDSKVAVLHSYKETSTQRGVGSLGTYVDSADAAFTGTWDLISVGDPHPLGIGVVVTEVLVVAPGAGVFTDMVFEPFDFACFGAVGTLPMLLNDPGVRNELWAFEQTSMFGSILATYDLGISSVIRDGNNLGYADFFNRDGGGAPGCFLAGSSGVWDWNGRSGTITFISNVPLPVLACGEIYEDTLAGFGDYRNDEDVIRTFSTGDASPLTMFFGSFDVEDGFDFMHIYDGPTTASPEIVGSPFTGLELAGMEITGTGDTLTFEFISDTSITAPGWLAEVCGTAAMPFVCTGATTSFTAGGLPLVIPDGACPTESIFPVTVSGLGFADVIGTDYAIDNVTIDIAHTFDADLEIHLVSPAGTFLDLSIGNGVGGDDYTATEFRDGGSSIVAGSPPFTGVFNPQGGTFAAAFAGEAATGDWSIQVCDNTGADEGMMLGFSISFCDAPVAPGAFRDFATPYAEKLNKATFTSTRSSKVKSNVTEKEFVSKRVNPVSLNKN